MHANTYTRSTQTREIHGKYTGFLRCKITHKNTKIMYTKFTQNLPLKIKWLKIGELEAIHLVHTNQKGYEETGLDYPIGPLGTSLGPRTFRGPQTLNQTNSIAKFALNTAYLPNFSLSTTALD